MHLRHRRFAMNWKKSPRQKSWAQFLGRCGLTDLFARLERTIVIFGFEINSLRLNKDHKTAIRSCHHCSNFWGYLKL